MSEDETTIKLHNIGIRPTVIRPDATHPTHLDFLKFPMFPFPRHQNRNFPLNPSVNKIKKTQAWWVNINRH